MNKLTRTFTLTLLALCCLPVFRQSALAARPATQFDDGRVIEFSPGSRYTETDMFSDFKDVMPGDLLSENITVLDECDDCDHIKVYLRALPHDGVNRELSEGVTMAGENAVSMRDFLSKLTMTVYNGSERIYRAHPDQTGELADSVYLGTIRKGESLSLRVVLEVPTELDERYMDREGEVDWVFLAEEFDQPETSPTPSPTASPTPSVKPSYKPTLIQTGQLWWPALLLAAAGAAMLLLGLYIKRRDGRA